MRNLKICVTENCVAVLVPTCRNPQLTEGLSYFETDQPLMVQNPLSTEIMESQLVSWLTLKVRTDKLSVAKQSNQGSQCKLLAKTIDRHVSKTGSSSLVDSEAVWVLLLMYL